MEFIKKYGWLILLIALVIIYFAFKAQIDRLLGMAKSAAAPSWAGCNKAFFAKLPDGKFISVNTSDEGTTGNPIIAYYKNEVEFSQDGITKSGTPVKIEKAEFDGYCKYLYNPPYAWYTDSAKGGTSVNPGRKFHGGGAIGGGGHAGGIGSGMIVGSYGVNTLQYQPVFDKDGNEVNTPSNLKQKACPIECLKPYPKGSQYEKYYYCDCGYGSGTFN